MTSLISSFGDVLVYELGMVRPPAILHSVLRSHDWMKQHLKPDGKLIVVGYSLGSLVAYDLIQQPRVKPDAVVTFGSPLKKANIIRQLHRDRLNLYNGAACAMLGLGMVFIAILLAFVGSEFKGLTPTWEKFKDGAWPNWHSEFQGWWILYGGIVGCVVLILSRLALWQGKPSKASLTEWVAPIAALIATGVSTVIALQADDWHLWPGVAIWFVTLLLFGFREWDRNRVSKVWLAFDKTIKAYCASAESKNAELKSLAQKCRAKLRNYSISSIREVMEELETSAFNTEPRVVELIGQLNKSLDTGDNQSLVKQLESIRGAEPPLKDSGLDSPVVTRKWTKDRWIAGLTLAAAVLTLSRLDASLSEVRFSYIIPALLAAIALFWSTIKTPLRLSTPDTTLYLDIQNATKPVPWLDLWAGADPVSEFGLELNTCRSTNFNLTSTMVHNQRRFPLDHSLFQNNDEEFNSRIVDGLFQNLGWSFPELDLSTSAGSSLHLAQRNRRWRVDCWLASFWFTASWMLLIPLMVGSNGLRELWAELSVLNSFVDWATEKVTGDDVNSGNGKTEWSANLGFLVVVITVLVWFAQVVERTWKYWDDIERTQFFQKGRVIPTSLKSWEGRGALVFLLTAFVVPVILLVITLYTTNHLHLTLDANLATASSWVFIAVLVCCLLAVFKSYRTHEARFS